MSKIFIFTAGDASAREHLDDSITNAIRDEIVFSGFDKEHHEELVRIRKEGDGFYAWGAQPGPRNRSTWNSMDRGDWVLTVYGNTYHYVAMVLAKYDNADLAREVWGEADGKTWQYMYFLSRPQALDRRVADSANFLNAGYFGFTKISDEKVQKISDSYGTIESFIDEMREGAGDTEDESALELVLSWIRSLKTQASPDGLFYYKPLSLLALLDVLDAQPEHLSVFEYEELLASFKKLADERGSSADETQFCQPYLRTRNDISPLQVWIPTVVGTAQLEDRRANQPAYVRQHAPSTQIAEEAWPAFSSAEGRVKIREEILSRWPSGRSYWWVNQGGTYRQERDGGYLWAPKANKSGTPLSHHTSLLRVKDGDVVLHYANGALRAASEVTEVAKEASRPAELPAESWNTDGYLVSAQYHELTEPIPLQEISKEARIAEGGPFTRDGAVKQGYFFSLSPEFVQELIRDFPKRWPDILAGLVERPRVWLFQANPKLFNLEEELKSMQIGYDDGWTVTRYREEMRSGDIALLWQGGKKAGIYAVGELTDSPYIQSYEAGDVPAWVTSKAKAVDGKVSEWRVPFRYTSILESPVLKPTLQEHPTLSSMQVLKSPMGTNFKVEKEEWEILQELLNTEGTNKQIETYGGSLNVILYGPPGTGKTYSVQRRALKILDPQLPESSDEELGERYRKYLTQGRIEFLTFHPSYSYEEFVEGYRFDVETQTPTLRDGVFKTLVNRAVNPHQESAVSEGARVWKVSLSRPSQPEILEWCIENDEIGVGWLASHDLTEKDREAIKELFGKHEGGDKATNSINSVDYFVNKIQDGDYVAVFRNRREIQAIGVVTGEYEYKGNHYNGYSHTRPVKWLDNDPHDIYEMNGSTNLTRSAIYPLDRVSLPDFVGLLPEHKRTTEPYVLVIDEINRGNISRIFGELITLLEADKRRGKPNEMSIRLPYSQQHFSVPSNLYVIGTMNTADRSIALLDVALRRRFEFEEMMPRVEVVRGVLQDKNKAASDSGLTDDQIDLVCHVFEILNRRITVRLDRDHQIGHSYFLNITSTQELHQTLYGKVFPLLQEYFYNDWESLRLILGEYDQGSKDKGFVETLEGEYSNAFGEDTPIYEDPSEFHVHSPESLEEVLRNTFGSP